MANNANGYIALENELDWLALVIHQSIASYLMQEGHEDNWQDIELPKHIECTYFECVKEWNLNQLERVALALAAAPLLRPAMLDVFFGKNAVYDRNFTEFGGHQSNSHSGFQPTLQTFLFIVTAVNPELRAEAEAVFKGQHKLMQERVFTLTTAGNDALYTNQIISLNEKWLHYFTTGTAIEMEHSADFPAHKITSPLSWDDLILDDLTRDEVDNIRAWLSHSNVLLDEWNLKNKIKPGYRSLFYGPPGTGKTLTASLLGKITNRPVYRVDLSMITSKYIGETEKNLAKIFDTATHKKWILFFDEADSLFGKRTAASSSNDRHANQQTGYLLQRIEDFPGVIILASNLKDNIDTAFSRRFQSMIHFKMPTVEQRYQLWVNAFDNTCELADDIDLYQVAEAYELAGGAIINVLRHCALKAVQRKKPIVTKADLQEGLKKEYQKENKTLAKKI